MSVNIGTTNNADVSLRQQYIARVRYQPTLLWRVKVMHLGPARVSTTISTTAISNHTNKEISINMPICQVARVVHIINCVKLLDCTRLLVGIREFFSSEIDDERIAPRRERGINPFRTSE